MTRVAFLRAARIELLEATAHYEAESSGLGHRFLAEVRGALDFIRSHPEGSAVLRGDVRRKVLNRFPYSLLYSQEPDHLLIVAVMNARRRPGYWLDRLA